MLALNFSAHPKHHLNFEIAVVLIYRSPEPEEIGYNYVQGRSTSQVTCPKQTYSKKILLRNITLLVLQRLLLLNVNFKFETYLK